MPVSDDDRAAAELAAALHAGTPGDVAFYLRAARGAARVLELGVGTGRVLAPLLAAGHHVTGVDVDPVQLTLARERVDEADAARATLIEASMSALGDDVSCHGPFDRVFIPFTGLFALPSHAAIADCLSGTRRVLADGGRLVFDVYPVDDEDCAPQEAEETGWDEVAQLQWRGRTVVVSQNDLYPGDACRVDTCFRYAIDGGETVEQRIAHCFATPATLVSLLVVAGFASVTLFGDFDGAPFDDDSERLVVSAC